MTTIERSVTSRYHGSKTFGSQQKGAWATKTENGKKATLHVHHAFVHIFWPSLHDYDMKLPISTRPLYGVGELDTKSLFFLFLNSDTVLSNSIQKISPTFDKLNEIE